MPLDSLDVIDVVYFSDSTLDSLKFGKKYWFTQKYAIKRPLLLG